MDYDTNPYEATGFVFDDPEPQSLLLTLQRALLLYAQRPDEMIRVQLHAMKQDFCWDKAASLYVALYEEVIGY